MLNFGSTPKITKAEEVQQRNIFVKCFPFWPNRVKKALTDLEETDANDEKCRRDANLMKEVERGHFVMSFFTGRAYFKLYDRAMTNGINVE